MNDLKNISQIVKEILIENPHARDNDDILYFKVCERVNPDDSFISFQLFMYKRKDLGFPPFESVRRTRQKIQAENPDLRGSSPARAARAAKEKEYKDYARSNAT